LDFSFNFFVSFFCEEQITLLPAEKFIVAHIDATGSIVPNYDKQRVFLYSFVTQLEEEEPCLPVIEFLTSCHKAAKLAVILFDLSLQLHFQQKSIGCIVTDFCYATMHAISYAFNHKTLKGQIEDQWLLMKNNKYYSGTLIRLCCSHYMANVCRKVGKLSARKEV